MIKIIEVNVPIQVEYEIHKGEASTNTHDQIEILNMCVHDVKIPWEIEKEKKIVSIGKSIRNKKNSKRREIMDDKNFSKLKLKIEQRTVELHELQKLHTIATGQPHLAGRLNPFCPECNEPMRHICTGTWECEKCKKE